MQIATQSYWQATSSEIELSTELPLSTDIVVIGGGIVNTSACYWLAREGMNVALLERNMIGYGATGRNGGFVVAGPGEPYQDAIKNLGHETAKAILQLTCENQTLLQQVLAEDNIQCDYRLTGNLRIAITEQDMRCYEEEARVLQADGFSIDLIDTLQVQAFIKTPNLINQHQFYEAVSVAHGMA